MKRNLTLVRGWLVAIVFALFALLVLYATDSVRGQASVPQTYDTLVLCTPQLKQALNRWVDYRASQGHRVLVLDSQRFARDNRALIGRTLEQYPGVSHLLLVGDAGDWRAKPTALLPADFVLATVNVNFGSEFDIATDNTYADLDDDGIPELAVGRIAATTAGELDQYIDRVIKYERATVLSGNVPSVAEQAWKRRINLVAGVGGFGQVTDALIENTTRKIITDRIPGGFKTSMTHGSWRSPYCPDPRCFSDTAVERFNEGCMFWVYLGHGERQKLDSLRVPDRRFDILDCDSVKGLHCRHGSPIAIFLACYAGAIDSSQDCLAEKMMKQPAGPIAVVAGSRVTMPYAMSLLAMEMSDEYFSGQCATVGQLLKNAKHKLAASLKGKLNSGTGASAGSGVPNNPNQADPYRQMIETMGQTLSPLPEMLAQEKTEHLHLINLLGDPLLRLQRPEKVVLKQSSVVVKDRADERMISVAGQVPFAGELVVELVYRRDRFRIRPKRRRKFDAADDSLAAYQRQYDRAHRLVCSAKQMPVSRGEFSAVLDVPDGTRGDCRVRVMLVGKRPGQFAIGSIDVDVPRQWEKPAAGSRRVSFGEIAPLSKVK